MKVFDSNGNASDVQIETGTSYLTFVVEKTKCFNSIPEFFGDENTTTCDKLKVMYSNRVRGQKSIIPNLPVFPLTFFATINEGIAKAYTDTSNKIVKVEFSIPMTNGGALDLNSNSSLNVETNFKDLKNMQIYSTDGLKTQMILMYETHYLNANVQKEIPLVGVTDMLFSKFITDFQLQRPEGYTINSCEKETEVISQALNEVAWVVGKDETYQMVVNGQTIASKPSFAISKHYAGGAFYNNIGVSDLPRAIVASSISDIVYTLKLQDTETM